MEQKNQSKLLGSILQLGNKKGKKQVLNRLLLKTLSLLKKIEQIHPVLILLTFANKIKPFCEIKTLQIAHRFYKVPVTIDLQRQNKTAFIWLLRHCNNRQENSFIKRLVNELLETIKTNNSQTNKVSKELHYVAQLNKMYIKYR
jgi:ribosomal protein S7